MTKNFIRLIVSLAILAALSATTSAADFAFDGKTLRPDINADRDRAKATFKNGGDVNYRGRLFTNGKRGVSNATVDVWTEIKINGQGKGVQRYVGQTKTDRDGNFSITRKYFREDRIPQNGATVTWWVNYVVGKEKEIKASSGNVHRKRFLVVP